MLSQKLLQGVGGKIFQNEREIWNKIFMVNPTLDADRPGLTPSIF